MSSLRGKGFTLIELLIVVAIIAILAAIAVPNFLEAQVRSKVARVKTDMRSVATSIESYVVDWNRAPAGFNEGSNWQPAFWGVPQGGDPPMRWGAIWSKLTTPVAYLTAIPVDAFGEKGRINQGGTSPGVIARYTGYVYHSVYATTGQGLPMPAIYGESNQKGVYWTLNSRGPSRLLKPWGWSGGRQVPPAAAKILDTSSTLRWPSLVYDSSNGTVSFGYLIRSNLGVL